MANGDFQDHIDAYSDEHDTDIICYFGDIERESEQSLTRACCSRERRRKNALLMLHTYGGDPNGAYRIARCIQQTYATVEIKDKRGRKTLQKKEGDFTVYLDGVCKSAGTIICLGADKLVMSPHAELGPIDVQLRKQDEIGERTSSLAPIQAITFLETQSLNLFKRHFRTLRFSDELGFSTKMAADLASKMAIGLMTPIYEQIDPIRLAEVDRSLRISSEYGQRLKTNNLNEGALDKLLAEYPSHGFVIDRQEARELFKVVEDPSPQLTKATEFLRALGTYHVENNENFTYYISNPPAEKKEETPMQGPALVKEAPDKPKEAAE